MSMYQDQIIISTSGRGLFNITDVVNKIIKIISKSNNKNGLCHIFIHHTSASLIISENTDKDVLHDLETFMSRLVTDGDPLFKHIEEGPDDMPSHIRTVLTQSALVIPIKDGKLNLGTWQGIFLWEHRKLPHERKLTITIQY